MEFFRTWSPLAAWIALLIPIVGALWKYFRKGRVDIFETGNIEIGYSGWGPSIGLHGTLRAVERDQFVRRIRVKIVKEKDQAQHKCEWSVFRSAKVFMGGKEEGTLELPAGFLVTTIQPYRYNILFADLVAQEEVRVQLQELRKRWNEFIGESSIRNAIMAGVTQGREQAAVAEVYEQFSNKADIWDQLNRICYWEGGRYKIEAEVNTSRPNKSFTRRWTFELTEADAERLRVNVLSMMREACGLGVTYSFAYAKYID